MAGSDNGPPAPPASLSAFDCPACGGSVNLTARGISISVYCTHCGAEIDANNDKFKVLRRAHGLEHASAQPLIPIGTRGTLEDILWEVIGFMQRSDKTGNWKWQEYLLFNPAQGFRWLIENRGHWTLFHKIEPPTSLQPAIADNLLKKLRYNKRSFEIFERGDAVVRSVLGEFYWRVKRGDKSRTADLISPPLMLSHEVIDADSGKESIWSLGNYLEPDIVANAFAITATMPGRYGPGPAQPNTRRDHFYFGVAVAVLCSILMLLGRVAVEGLHPQKTVYSARFGYDNRDKTIVGDSFQIERDTVLRFDVNSNVDNRWAELEIELVNDDTGETRHVNTGVESWSGYEDGYYWHDGSASNSAVVSPVAAGKWHINTDYSVGDSLQTAARNVVTQIKVVEGAYGWGNLLLALAMVWIPSLILGGAARMFDMNRWELSDYSPYQEFSDYFE